MPMMWNGRLGFWGRCVGFYKLQGSKTPKIVGGGLKNRHQHAVH